MVSNVLLWDFFGRSPRNLLEFKLHHIVHNFSAYSFFTAQIQNKLHGGRKIGYELFDALDPFSIIVYYLRCTSAFDRIQEKHEQTIVFDIVLAFERDFLHSYFQFPETLLRHIRSTDTHDEMNSWQIFTPNIILTLMPDIISGRIEKDRPYPGKPSWLPSPFENCYKIAWHNVCHSASQINVSSDTLHDILFTMCFKSGINRIKNVDLHISMPPKSHFDNTLLCTFQKLGQMSWNNIKKEYHIS
jgi:hypothetical protein